MARNHGGDEELLLCNGTGTYTDTQKNTLLIIAGSNGSISFIMCIVAVSLVFFLKFHRKFTYRLALYQVLSGMMFSFSVILYFGTINYDSHSLPYNVVCKAQAFLTQYFLWVKLSFTMFLLFHLFCLAVFLKNFEKLEMLYILFSTLFPLTFTWIPFIHNNYDIAGAWCWIRDWKDDCAQRHYLEGIIEQFAIWYGPLFFFLTVSIVIALIAFSILLWRICRMLISSPQQALLVDNLKQKHKRMLKNLFPLLAYPIIFWLISLFPIINRVYDAISHSASFELSLIHSITNFSMGMFSSIVLIVHIAVVKCNERSQLKRTHVYQRTGDPTAQKSTTSYRTTYLVPEESEVDKLLDNIQ